MRLLLARQRGARLGLALTADASRQFLRQQRRPCSLAARWYIPPAVFTAQRMMAWWHGRCSICQAPGQCTRCAARRWASPPSMAGRLCQTVPCETPRGALAGVRSTWQCWRDGREGCASCACIARQGSGESCRRITAAPSPWARPAAGWAEMSCLPCLAKSCSTRSAAGQHGQCQ